MILLVEDEATVRGLVHSMLAKLGYVVLEGRNVHEAMQICKDYHDPIDLLVTDVMMPGLSGPELAQQLVVLKPQLRVLFMSGYADTAIDRYRGLPLNAALLQKPFFSADLKKKVREVLEA